MAMGKIVALAVLVPPMFFEAWCIIDWPLIPKIMAILHLTLCVYIVDKVITSDAKGHTAPVR